MKQTVGKNRYLRQSALGAALSLAIYILLLALCSYLTVRGVIGEERLRLLTWIAAGVSALAGAALCARKTERRMAVVSGAAGGFYLAVLLLGFVIGDTMAWGSALRLLVPVALGAGALLLPGGRTKRGKNRAKRSRRARK